MVEERLGLVEMAWLVGLVEARCAWVPGLRELVWEANRRMVVEEDI